MSFSPSRSHKPVLERAVMWHYFYLSIFFPSVFYLFVHKLGRFLNSTCECQRSECNATETEISCHLSNASLVLKVSNKFVKMWAAACTQNIQLGLDSDTCFHTKCCLFLQITSNKICHFQKIKQAEKCGAMHLCYMAGSAACWLLYSCENSNQFKHVCVPVSWQNSTFLREMRICSDFLWKEVGFFCLHRLLTCRKTGAFLPFANLP